MITYQTDKPILSVGDVCPDIILPFGESRQAMAAHMHGETSHCAHATAGIFAGGSVANTAHGIAVLGGGSWFAGKVGNDYYGHFLQGEFKKAGVDTRYLVFDDRIPTSMVIIVVDEHNDRVNFAIPRQGASQHQLENHELPEDLTDQIGWLHTSGILLRENPAAETILELMHRCRQTGIHTSLDLNFRIEALGNTAYVERIRRAIQLSSVVLGSGDEEMMPITGERTPQAAARVLVEGERLVVCRGGSSGADIYLPDGRVFHQDAYVVPVVDTLGAGDAYNAGFITALTRGESVVEANRVGSAVAAYKITGQGARNFPNPAQLEEFLRTHSTHTG